MQPFDYLISNLSKPVEQGLEQRHIDMFRREIRERAALLFNLQFQLEAAVERIENNLRWEFDETWTRVEPSVLHQVKEIVAEVYRKRTPKKE